MRKRNLKVQDKSKSFVSPLCKIININNIMLINIVNYTQYKIVFNLHTIHGITTLQNNEY